MAVSDYHGATYINKVHDFLFKKVRLHTKTKHLNPRTQSLWSSKCHIKTAGKHTDRVFGVKSQSSLKSFKKSQNFKIGWNKSQIKSSLKSFETSFSQVQYLVF